jgi:hypothetical protein
MFVPGSAAAHVLAEQYRAPLPLVAYVVGAALAVAMSFAFVMLRQPSPTREEVNTSTRRVPTAVRRGLRLVGLVAWLWIVAQAVVGGAGDSDVSSLFLWVYGWVGVALVSALIGPLWTWLDPFSTIHIILAWIGDRLGLRGGGPRPYPARLGIWPAVAGFAFIIWIELVARIEGGSTLGLILVGYTLVTLAGMSWFGRGPWRRNGEVFGVWFGLLGRLAPFALVGPPRDGLLERRPFAAGLRAPWSVAQVVLVALGTGAIIFDGLSQTQIYFDLFRQQAWFGLTTIFLDTIVATLFLALIVGAMLAVARRLGTTSVGAGVLPVAVGYLIAHYVVFLLVDGQRIVHALNDPLQRGDNLLPFDLGFYEPELFLPTAIVWTIQLAAVVGGHVLGAWAGHAALADSPRLAGPVAQLPLAGLMVGLTSLTLWSLGQAVIIDPEAATRILVALRVSLG